LALAEPSGWRRDLKITAVQRSKPGETNDHATPINAKEKSFGRVREFKLYPFGCAALAIIS
jgi:hypothetical protein